MARGKKDFLEIKKENGSLKLRLESWSIDAKIEKVWIVGGKVVQPAKPMGTSETYQVMKKKKFEKLVLQDPPSTVKIICTEHLPFAVITLRDGDLLGWVWVRENASEGKYSPHWTIYFSLRGAKPPLIAEARHLHEAIALKQQFPWLPLKEIVIEVCRTEFLLKFTLSDIEKIITHLEAASEELDAPLHVQKPEDVLILHENLKENRRVVLVYKKAEYRREPGKFYLMLQHWGRYTITSINDSPDGMRTTTPSPYHVGYIDYKEFEGWHSLRPEEWTDKDRELYEKYKKFVEEDPDIQAWKRQWRRREEVLKNELEYCYKRRQLYNALGLPRTDAYITHVLENLKAWKKFLYGG